MTDQPRRRETLLLTKVCEYESKVNVKVKLRAERIFLPSSFSHINFFQFYRVPSGTGMSIVNRCLPR